MIRNLRSGSAKRVADVAIIGAGIAGLCLADRLRRLGKRIIVIESGDFQPDRETDHPLNTVEILDAPYNGATEGRARGLGGTSVKWGGALLPLLPEDLDSDSAQWGINWPIRYNTLASYIAEAEAVFGLRGGPSDVIDPRTPDFIERKAKWPKFEKRNVANLFGPNLRNDEGLEVWLNATVTVPTFEPNGRVTEISARSDRGQELRVEAADFVIAAGGIESTRLALSFNRASADNLMATDSPVGHYFHEHLTAHCASVEVRDRRELGRLAGFLFQRDGMRNLRFELSGSARTREALPAAYTQLVFSSEQGGPFDVLRDIYRGFQAKSRPSAAQIAFLAGHAPWLLRAAWSRFIDHRLLPPDDAQFALNLAIEQQPKFESRIALSDRTDSLGQPLAMINWRPSAADQENFRAVTGLVGSYWQTMGFDCLGLFAARREAADELVQCGGSHHPGGTLRMGRDAREGVVDADLRIFGSPNLWVASSAVFPRAGGANPTLTLVALALRLGDRLARD